MSEETNDPEFSQDEKDLLKVIYSFKYFHN